MEPRFQVQLKIRKPVAEVFEAVADPAKLSGYFVHKASGRLASGKTVRWKFAELDEEFDVAVPEAVANQRIVLEWESEERGYDTRVEMTFKPLDAGSTLVQISESGWRETEQGIAASYSNCGGWMHMLVCLKGYLEYGVNLREGGAL
jgi:uncharacterized protein YndB with AHSA1/START domain